MPNPGPPLRSGTLFFALMATPFKVLAIDGGGIRGIIPALILEAIEERTNRPISSLFDMLSGTSTGGIIALGLTLPAEDGKPAKSAHDIVNLYEREGRTILDRKSTRLNSSHIPLSRLP